MVAIILSTHLLVNVEDVSSSDAELLGVSGDVRVVGSNVCGVRQRVALILVRDVWDRLTNEIMRSPRSLAGLTGCACRSPRLLSYARHGGGVAQGQVAQTPPPGTHATVAIGGASESSQ